MGDISIGSTQPHLQTLLALFANQRKHKKYSILTRINFWYTNMVADSAAIHALGVISTNLHYALKKDGSLDASIEVATFWAPFLLLHLGGPDTFTAHAPLDTEAWVRHFSSLIGETVLTLHIFFTMMGRSRLSTLSAMMLVAGVIKYGERTLSLWFASYKWRRSQTVKDHKWSIIAPPQFVQWDENVENEHLDEELLAAKMFPMTERMFADALLQDDRKSPFKRTFRTESSSMVSKLITMELELMYENLYTKAKVIRSWWGLALRLISFLLILITLISYSCLHHRYNYSTFQQSLTFLLLGVAILLEGYAAFVFLTSSWTISWLREHHMDTASQAMKSLSSLRTPRLSNSMGQFSVINSYLRPKPAVARSSKVISTFYRIIFVFIMRKSPLISYVYERPVKDYVKEEIHKHLKQAEYKYKGRPFSILNSRGRIPWTTWKEEYRNHRHATGLEVDPTATGLNFDDMGFGEMVILWHFVTEVCYYYDYDSLIGWKGKSFRPQVYRDWKMSKYLSRYLMQLYLDSSDMLPPRVPLSEQKLFDYWSLFFGEHRIEKTGKAADDRPGKQGGRKRENVLEFRNYWTERPPTFLDPILDEGVNLMKALVIEEDPQSNASKEWKLEQNWKLLSEVWIELLINAASQSKGNQHAQQLGQGGEFLTYVWVLLGYLGLLELS